MAGITSPVWLSVNDPDNGIGDVEGDICVLDNGLVVVVRMSSYSYAVTLQAINPATTPPTVGPEKYANLDTDWGQYPGYEVFAGKIDPGGQVWNDVGQLSPMGGNIFCHSGASSETLNAAGQVNPWPYTGSTYYSAASVYTVNPGTLEISLVKHAVGEYDSTPPFDPNVSWYADETTTARWGDKTIVLPSQNTPDRYKMAVVSPDGSCDIIDVLTTATNANRPGPVMCSGDIGVLYTEHGSYPDGSLVSFNPANGAFISTIPCPVSSEWQWGAHCVTLPNGLIAMVTVGPGDVSSPAPVWVMIIDPSPLSIVKHFQVTPSLARIVGWTGGWYSNVRSIDVYPDGTLLVSAVDDSTRLMMLFEVDPETEVVTARDVPPFEWLNGQNFISQAVTLGSMGWAAIWVASRSSNYGVYYSQFYAVPTSISSRDLAAKSNMFEGRH